VNCQANLPTYEKWQAQFARTGFTIIGIHTPELPEEYKIENVRKFVKEHGIVYPVLMDKDYKNWNRWNQEYWPALYLVDKKGEIREAWFGELGSNAAGFEKKIETLLRE